MMLKNLKIYFQRIFPFLNKKKIFDEEVKSSINRATLCFKDKELNKEFSEELAKNSVKVVRLSMLLGIVIYIIFGIKYQLVDSPDKYLFYRGIGIAEFSAVLILTFFNIYKKYSQFIISGLILLGGFNVLIIALDSGNNLYVGIILTSIYAHSLLRFRFVFASLSTWILVAAYITIISLSPHVSELILINNIFFLTTANLLGMVASYSIEYYMRANFFRSKQLSEKSKIVRLECERKSNELDIAREIQLSMLPKTEPLHPFIDLSFSMKTASEIGGDYYDYHLSEDFTLTFAVGDATGHGAQAGVMVTALKILFTNYAHKIDLTEFMRKADYTIKQIGLPRLYMSLAMGRLKGNILEITGVGMPPLLIFRNNTRRLEKINLKGLPLGSVMKFPYTKHSIKLLPGDIILLMTDGFPEAFNYEREMLGYERIERLFIDESKNLPRKIINRFNSTMTEWTKEYGQHDDVTMMVIKMKDINSVNLSSGMADKLTAAFQI